MAKIFFLLSVIAALNFSDARNIEVDPLIVGGEPASIADFPHSLAILDLVRGGYLCGASNIHRLWALTAAHCVDFGTPFEMINLYGGSTSRLSGGHLFFISRYVMHPGYNRQTIDLDIAVIEIDPATPLEGFTFVTPIRISPICATACCDVCPEGNQIVVAGWGRVDDGSLPEMLRQVSKDIITIESCRDYWTGIGWTGGISHSKFCTRVENGRDSCNGDSGSAIVRNGVQVGLVSFGSLVCGDGTVPAVYVRLEEPTVRNFIAGFVDV